MMMIIRCERITRHVEVIEWGGGFVFLGDKLDGGVPEVKGVLRAMLPPIYG